MGCTSSAQNMPPSLSNSVSEKELKLLKEDEMVEREMPLIIEKGNESNAIQVLPTCDTLGESTHLDRNKYLVDLMNPDLDKGTQANGLVRESENESRITDENTPNHITTESTQTDEKLSTLEEVVEKVVEFYADSALEVKLDEQSGDTESLNNLEDEEKEEDKKEKQRQEKEIIGEEGEVEAVVSPSQSQCSRATRWEALADIAAELPPSLAVDPITGQIYSLSK